MRAAVFRHLLGLLERHPKGPFRQIELQILLNLTAGAFDVPGRNIWRLPYPKALRAYADFTISCLERERADPRRLYARAFALGARIRRVTGFKAPADAARLVFFLYRNLSIAMEGELPGTVTVSACYFSRFYTPRQCATMSALDSGVISGICGGGKLIFTERLTEGCGRCRARLTRGEHDAKH